MIYLGTGQRPARPRFNPTAALVAAGGQVLLFAMLAWMAPPSILMHVQPAPSIQVVYVSPELFAGGSSLPAAAAVAPADGAVALTGSESAPAVESGTAPAEPAPAAEAPRAEPARPRSVALARPSAVVEPPRAAPASTPEPSSASPRAVQIASSAPPASTPAVVPSTPPPAPVATPAPAPAVVAPVERAPAEPKGETRGPRVLKYAQPAYPSIARSQRIGGTVVVEITVGDDGAVEDAAVLQAPSPLLHQAAVDAARKMRFEPALSNGKPIRAKFTQPFTFKLSQ